MNTNLFKTAVAALALLVTFNSCKEKEEEFEFPYGEIELLVEDGRVFTNYDELVNTKFTNVAPEVSCVYVTTTPEYNAPSGSWRVDDTSVGGGLMPYTKYYWYLDAKDKNGKSGYSEIRSFYYAPAPKIEPHNVEGDWAIVLKWEHNDMFEDAQVIMTPNKDCNYDKNPIKVPAGQDSCYISAGTIGNQKYQIYHNWWDEANGKYYEPVVYDFNLTVNCNIDGRIFPISATKKGIFLNTDGYVADSCFNVYRYAKIGNRTWMLDDLRIKLDDTTLYTTVKLESGLELVLYADYILLSDAGVLMDNPYDSWYVKTKNEKMIPKGFHLATDEDWYDLESHFGVEPSDYWYRFATYYENANKYIVDANNLDKYKYNVYPDSLSIYDHYSGKGTRIRDHLIADNEWIDFNDSSKKLNGSHIFNAHPAGIPYKSADNGSIVNPYKGYGVAFCTSGYRDACRKRILWSGCDGICRMQTCREDDKHDIIYSLYRCVKDE